MILSLDIATKTGYAMNSPLLGTRAGTLTLATSAELKNAKTTRLDRRCDLRVTALFEWTKKIINCWGITLVVFEDVKFARSQAQAHLWASLRGAVWCACNEHPTVGLDCLDTGKLKIFATDTGAADKPAMAAALVRKEPAEFVLHGDGVLQLPRRNFLDDNAVDAIHLLRWAQKIYEKP